MKKLFFCETCGESFTDEMVCENHERMCVNKKIFKCSKCDYKVDLSEKTFENYAESQACHKIDLGIIGYGSLLEGHRLILNLCDKCLLELVSNLNVEGRELILNSFSDKLPTEKWIKMHKGEMLEDELEELGFLSERQVQAYIEQFPICDKVFVAVNSGISIKTMCPMGATGKENGEISTDISSKCYGCCIFKEKENNSNFKKIEISKLGKRQIEQLLESAYTSKKI